MFVLLFIGGLLIALYPTISNRWNEKRFQQLMTTYDDVVGEAEDYTEEKEWKKEKKEKAKGHLIS